MMRKSRLEPSDSTIFAQEMADVAPLNAEQKVLINKHADNLELDYRRQAAESSTDDTEAPLSLVLRKTLLADDWLSFKRNGIQEGVFKNLRLGKYPLEATLNLQQQTPQRARDELQLFLQDAEANNLRSLLITFGRGKQGVLLKSYLAQWLVELGQVQVFHTALKHHGGVGAVYVLLRKSEARRQQNRERHAARLGHHL
jgi:DNA-nicking Smr family endonuclease